MYTRVVMFFKHLGKENHALGLPYTSVVLTLSQGDRA